MTQTPKAVNASTSKRTRLAAPVRRQYILDAALEEFSVVGFEGATVERIAAQAGITKAGLYAHFKSKEALFEALLDSIMLSSIADESWVLDPESTLEAAVDSFLELLYGAIDSPRSIAIIRLLIVESGRNPHRVQQWYQDSYRPYMEKRQRLIEAYLRQNARVSSVASGGHIALAFSPAVLALLWQMVIGGESAAIEVDAIRSSHRELLLRLLSMD